MSLHLQDTLTSAADHAHQIEASESHFAGLTSEGVTPVPFSAFGADRDRVRPSFANPPETTEIAANASTRA